MTDWPTESATLPAAGNETSSTRPVLLVDPLRLLDAEPLPDGVVALALEGVFETAFRVADDVLVTSGCAPPDRLTVVSLVVDVVEGAHILVEEALEDELELMVEQEERGSEEQEEEGNWDDPHVPESGAAVATVADAVDGAA